MQGKGFFLGLFLLGSMHASERGGDLEGVVHYPGMQSLKAAHQREQEHMETVSLPGATDFLEQQNYLSFTWETSRDLRAQRDDTQVLAVQRRNVRDFTAEEVVEQVAVPQVQTRKLCAWLLTCFFCLPRQEDEVHSMSSISPSLFGGRRSHTPPPDTLEQLRRESLELVEVSPLSNRRSLTPYPSMSISQEGSVFEAHSV